MKMRVDRGSTFTSVNWTHRAEDVGKVMQESRVEAHNALGFRERYNAPLRNIFLKIREEHLKMNRHIVLKMAVKAMNDIIGSKGLVASLLQYTVSIVSRCCRYVVILDLVQTIYSPYL